MEDCSVCGDNLTEDNICNCGECVCNEDECICEKKAHCKNHHDEASG